MVSTGRPRPNIRLVEACDKYLSRIEAEGQAESTIRTTSYALTRLRKAIDATSKSANPYVHMIGPASMDDYCYGKNGIRAGGGSGRPITAASFNRYRSCLRSFFDYAVKMGWTDQNPMDAVSAARPDQAKPKLILSATELVNLLGAASNPVERIGCALGMNTGLRGNDIRHLTILDANIVGGDIQTQIRKTNKIDSKPISLDLHWELMHWLSEYASLSDLPSLNDLPGEWLLVPSYRPPAPNETDKRIHLKPLQVHTNPWRLVQRPLARLGFPTKGQGFHTLRRSSARALFEQLRQTGEGRDHALMVVKDFLNHSSVVQTEAYLGLNHERQIRDETLRGKPFLSALAATDLDRLRSLAQGE